MRRAFQHEQSGDLDSAVDLYRRLVVEHPKIASAHLSLALLLHDYMQDYVGAIHHYRAYLLLRPNTEKAALLRNRQRMAERLLAAQLARVPPGEGVAGLDAHTVSQIQAFSDRLTRAEAEAATLRKEKSVLDKRIIELENDKRRLERRLEMLLAPPGTAVPREPLGMGEPVRATGTPHAGRTYEVRHGDNLSRIAELVYGDASQWRRIRDANQDKIDGEYGVRPWQVLTIP